MEKDTQFTRRNFMKKLSAGTLGLVASEVVSSGNTSGYLTVKQSSKLKPWKQVYDKKIRIGIVGGGFGASFFWHQHPNCIVEAVSDLQAKRNKTIKNVNKVRIVIG